MSAFGIERISSLHGGHVSLLKEFKFLEKSSYLQSKRFSISTFNMIFRQVATRNLQESAPMLI